MANIVRTIKRFERDLLDGDDLAWWEQLFFVPLLLACCLAALLPTSS